MAERKLGILSKTEEPKEEPKKDPKEDKIKGVAVGLKSSEWARLAELAGELGANRHSLAVWVLREFLAKCETGWRPETTTKITLR